MSRKLRKIRRLAGEIDELAESEMNSRPISNEAPLLDVSEREIVQMMAAQKVVMDHHEELDAEYKEQIAEYAEEYGVEHQLLDG